MGLSENVGYIPNEIAIFHRDNDQQNHWENGVHDIFRHTQIAFPVKIFPTKPIHWLGEMVCYC